MFFAYYLKMDTTVSYTQTNKIPVIMYHKIVDNPDEVTDFVITDKMLAEDFEEIKSRGYTTFSVCDFDKACKAAENGVKPIIITFDDGYKGIYTYALPLLKKYGFKASFYICGEFIDMQNPEYCSWSDVKHLYESGLAEIGNHTYSLHNKTREEITKLYDDDFECALADIIKNDNVIEENTGIKPQTFSFPYGVYNDKSMQSLYDAGYKMLVSTDYVANTAETKILGRFNRPASFTIEEFLNMVEEKCRQ